MGRVDVESMLEELTAQDLLRWMDFLAVRQERFEEARRRAADGFDDDEETRWGEE